MAAGSAYKLPPEPAPPRHVRGSRVAGWIVAALVVLVFAVFVASYFLDPIVRSRVENTMNQKLVGYHTRLGHAHLQLLSLTLILNDLVVKQNAHPSPPVADFPQMTFDVQWRELVLGRVVGQVLLNHPHVHINLIQLEAQNASKVPLRKEGWQEAIQSVYPFKINLFRVEDGGATYIDTDPDRPLYLKDIELRADNIRNIRSKDQRYPSPIWAKSTVFDNGRLTIEGKANFLDDPFPGVLGNYSIERIPLSKFEPVVQRANLHGYQGILQSKGVVEYSPRIARAEVETATIDGVHLDYVHTAQTAAAETSRIRTVKNAAAKVNNAPGIELKAHEVVLTNSTLKFINNAANPNYRIVITDTNLRATNLSNHQSEGTATINFNGKLMGSGDTKLTAVLRPEHEGPNFDFDLESNDTDLTAFNDLLRAYGKFDVASGKVSVFSQVTVKNHYVSGYIKPLFTDLKVYDSQKDKKKPVLKKAYEVVIGGAAKLLKNRRTKEVATKIDISGPIKNPNVDPWQAIGQFIYNAFVNAIVPGFDKEVAQARQAS
ncbi:DUF748 domain-containing protein [Candidatus Binatus sp.]|uniref:DUF748 domain-containing protein n=1 Tax=Candidatus Binatus sp. TaxID=2811406 RepID=UPI003BB05345